MKKSELEKENKKLKETIKHNDMCYLAYMKNVEESKLELWNASLSFCKKDKEVFKQITKGWYIVD